MRIALLLCGEPRYSPTATQSLLHDICDPLRRCGHSVDTLCALWTTRIPPGVVPPRSSFAFAKDTTPRIYNYNEQAALCRSLKTVAASFLTKPVIDVSWMQPLCRKDVTTYAVYCQFLSWYLGKQLIEQAESLGSKYDLVIRTRTDLVFRSPLILPATIEQAIYVPAVEAHSDVAFDTSYHCNDQLALGPRDVMGSYLELHRHYDALKADMRHFELPERMLHFYITRHIGCALKTIPLRYDFQR